MNDQEMIDRLRRALHERAEAIEPRPAALPSQPGPVPVSPEAVPPEAVPPAAVLADYPTLTAEYPTLPSGGPAPARRPLRAAGPGAAAHRRRWAAGAAGAALVAAAVVAAVVLPGGRHPLTVGPGPASPGPQTPPTSPAIATAPATAPGAVPSRTTPPAATTDPVPSGFQPQSVTFVSADDGWAIGWARSRCAVVVRTTDGGRTWVGAGGPATGATCGAAASPADSFRIRFADRSDGWIYAGTGTDPVRGRVWSTHDGGTHWTQSVPLAGGSIDALEASAGYVHMVVDGPCSAAQSGCQGQTVEEILTSPADADQWRVSPLNLSIGAGPVPAPVMSLWGGHGWLINNNRTAVSGARLTPGSGWAAWAPACQRAGGAGLVAAASAVDLVAVCAEGAWGTPDAGTTAGRDWLFRSADGGSSFAATGDLPGGQPVAVTTPPGDPRTVVVATGTGGLTATFDGGSTWTAAVAGGTVFDYVGFTTATQGVALTTGTTTTGNPGPAAVYMTRDGGRHWSPVSFGAT